MMIYVIQPSITAIQQVADILIESVNNDYQKPTVMKLRQPNSIQRAWAPQSMLWDFLKDPSQSLSLGSASNKTTWEYRGEAYLVFVPSSPLLFPSLSEPLPETKDLMEGNAEKSCSHSKGRREADLWGKILKDRNTHSLAQQPGWRMGAHLSQPGNIRGESTLRSAERRGQNTGSFILERTHRHPVTC